MLIMNLASYCIMNYPTNLSHNISNWFINIQTHVLDLLCSLYQNVILFYIMVVSYEDTLVSNSITVILHKFKNIFLEYINTSQFSHPQQFF